MSKTAVIFSRVSSVGERQSNDRQVTDLKKYAQYADLTILDIFEEKLSGAKKNNERQTLTDCIDYCINNNVDILLSSELSRLGRGTYEVLEVIKKLVDNKINLYLDKEQFTLLDEAGAPSLFAPIMLATLSTCAELERENIKFRMQSGLKQYRERGGKTGVPKGWKTDKEKFREKHKSVIAHLKKGTSIRDTAVLCDTSVSTVQRVKKYFNL